MSLAEVLLHIDRVDEGIIKLLAARQKLVAEAAAYQPDKKAARHQAGMIAQRRKWASAEGLSPDQVQRVYEVLTGGA